MSKAILVALIAASCLIGCKKSSVPSRPDDNVQLKLKELAGPGATDCGRFDVRAPEQQLTRASNCATNSAQSRRPFYVAYDMPGMTTGVAGNSQGKLFAVELQGSGPGAQLASGACPGDMRVAKSGRITCFIPGTMGLNPSAADPHSGISMNPQASPPGGMGIPQPLTPSPFPGASNPPAKKK